MAPAKGKSFSSWGRGNPPSLPDSAASPPLASRYCYGKRREESQPAASGTRSDHGKGIHFRKFAHAVALV